MPSDERSAIQDAWHRSDDGRSFQAALKAQGFTLAQGNRRLVVIDRYDKAVNPVRQLEGVRAAAFMARLADLDLSALPTAAAAQKAARLGERERHADPIEKGSLLIPLLSRSDRKGVTTHFFPFSAIEKGSLRLCRKPYCTSMML